MPIPSVYFGTIIVQIVPIFESRCIFKKRYFVLKIGWDFYLTFCSVHQIEQNICQGCTSINKGCAVYYYSVTQGLRISRHYNSKIVV